MNKKNKKQLKSSYIYSSVVGLIRTQLSGFAEEDKLTNNPKNKVNK